MADHVADTFREMEKLAKEHECVAVGFSGGKDSLATLDLATKHFKRVIPYFLYFVPGLKCEERKIEIAKSRYNLDVLMMPHPNGINSMRIGSYCDECEQFDALPDLSGEIMDNWIKTGTGATLILTGEKMADGPFRRRSLNARAKKKHRVMEEYYPLKKWLKWEVLNYLKAQRIPIPDAGSGDSGNVSLGEGEILYLYRHHPEDYERLKLFFPYIEVEVRAAAWFGDQAEGHGARAQRSKRQSHGEV